MEQLRRALESNGFALPSIQLDGKIHRFNRNGNDNAWFIGFQNHGIKDGKVYVVAQYGDWKTGEKFDYKPAGMSKIDLEACKAQIEQAKLRVAQEKLHKQHEAAAKAEKQWKSAGEAGTTPYMARKKIDQCYGIKIYQDTMQVPLRDSDGKLWGLQYIFGDGKKDLVQVQKSMVAFTQLDKMGPLTDPLTIMRVRFSCARGSLPGYRFIKQLAKP